MHLVEPSFRGLLSGLGGLQIYIGWAALLGQFGGRYGKRVLYVVYSELLVLHFNVGSDRFGHEFRNSKDMKI